VLIVEDNVLNAKMLSNMLKVRRLFSSSALSLTWRQHDYDVIIASNGLEALAAVQNRTPDLVLMDIQVRTTAKLAEWIESAYYLPVDAGDERYHGNGGVATNRLPHANCGGHRVVLDCREGNVLHVRHGMWMDVYFLLFALSHPLFADRRHRKALHEAGCAGGDQATHVLEFAADSNIFS
jgi:hypothetical protein